MTGIATLLMAPAQLGGLIPRGSRVVVFQRIYWVFLVLGTLVGLVVISYTLWKAYKYRDRDGIEDDGVDRPELGEVPQGGGGGRKLFLSFSLSAIIVISLIVWTYGTLLYVETAPAQETDALNVEVQGYQFGWEFHYPNGYVADSTAGDQFRVPANRMVYLEVTSQDVFHNFGITALRVKADAIPGQTTDTWFEAEEPGQTYTARCFELCGAGHSFMTAEVVVMPQDEWEAWYANTSASESSGGTPTPTPTEAASSGGH